MLFSPIIASLFMKAFSLNGKVYHAMLARGFGNEFERAEKKSTDIKSIIFLILCAFISITMLVFERQGVIQWLLL